MPVDFLGYGYAAVVASGGVVGYAKAGSTISLVMGLLFGGLSALGAYQMSQNPNSYQLLMGTSGALMGLMGYRFYGSGKFMPAGLVAGLSLAMFARMSMRAMAVKTKND